MDQLRGAVSEDGPRIPREVSSEKKGGLVEEMAVGQSQWYHFGVGAPPILVYFSGDWDAHWGCGVLTNGQMSVRVSFG